jgi:hypothetical protein
LNVPHNFNVLVPSSLYTGSQEHFLSTPQLRKK